MVVPQLATFAVVASGFSQRWQVALRISLALLNGYLLTMHGLAADVGVPTYSLHTTRAHGCCPSYAQWPRCVAYGW